MNASSIFAKLQAEFGTEVVVGVVVDNPDASIKVLKGALGQVASYLKHTPGLDFDFLESISGVDLEDKLEICYHLFSYKHRHSLVLKADVPYDDVLVPSVAAVWAAANWHEREQYDLFGFDFVGHPDLRRILLPEDWVGHPLRKNYVYPTQYHNIDHQRLVPAGTPCQAAEKLPDQVTGEPGLAANGDTPRPTDLNIAVARAGLEG